MRRRPVAAFPLYLLHFALVLSLALPASSHAQRQRRSHRTAAGAAAKTADPARAPATPPAGDGPSARVPPSEASPDPDPILAPGALTLSASATLVQAGQPFTVTVEVHDDPGSSAEGSTLSLQIDPALELLSGESLPVADSRFTDSWQRSKTWTLPDLEAAPFSERLRLHAPLAQPGDVFKLTASINQAGFAPQQRSILLGVESDDALAVLLDPLTARAGTRTAVKTLPAADDEQPQLVRAWEIEALSRRGRRVGALAAPATLVIDARPLITEGIDPTRLGLYTRADNDDSWRPARSQYRAEEQRFVARIDRFSQWGLGEKLTSDSDLLPSSAVFSSDEFTGYARINIPIAAPAGLGGLTPGLSLNYSSGVADDLESIHGPTAYKAQANWAGYGWSLGGLSHIARAGTGIHANHYNLTLGDVAVRIQYANNRWITDPERFLRIERNYREWSGIRARYPHHPVHNDRIRYDIDDWVITASDGTVYHFGSDQVAPTYSAVDSHGGEPVGNWTEVFFDDILWGHVSSNWYHARVGSRWHLRMVEDPNGNRIEYAYDVEQNEFRCLRMAGTVYGDDRLYDRMVYPSVIRWSANAGAGVEPKLRVRFVREERPDFEIESERCDQPRFGKERLKAIVIEAWDNPNGWHSVAEYELEYVQNELHSLLSSVTRKGKQGEQTLRRWRFGYAGSGQRNTPDRGRQRPRRQCQLQLRPAGDRRLLQLQQAQRAPHTPRRHRSDLARRNRRRRAQRLRLQRHQGSQSQQHARVPGPRLEPALALHTQPQPQYRCLAAGAGGRKLVPPA